MEARDPAIKLFGKEIALPENGKIPVASGGDGGVEGGWSKSDLSSVMSACLEGNKVSRIGDEEQGDEEEEIEVEAADKENIDPETLPELEENPITPSIEEETGSSKPPECESNDQTDASNSSQQKALKKPDKILPCPRCSSMDTKFCYFNNYNVNQPRHFCKSCQRYWTAGGTMRNVPVGAGRRKNKNPSASHLHCRQIAISEVLHAARIDPPNGIHNPTFKSGGKVLNFGPEVPLCESMNSVLNLAENMTAPSGVWNGFYKGGNGNDCYGGSPVTSLNSMEEGMRNGVQDPMIGKLNGFTSQMSQIPCLPGIPWPYPWNSALPVPAFCPPEYPISFYTAPYWNCGVPNGWSVPWLSPPPPATNQKTPSSAPNYPLGKHSRNGDLIKPSSPEGKEEVVKQNSSERSILVPKTLRIDDPDEAAKSSIWATLGIKNDSVGLFKAAFQPKSVEKNRKCETHPALRANPAAMSRSLSFQEGV